MLKTFGSTTLLWFLISTSFLTAPVPADGQDPETSNPSQDPSGEDPPAKRHYVHFAIGAAYWASLAKVDPAQAGYDPQQFGHFKDWGYNLEMAYHYLATKWFDRDLWIGADLGLFYNENEGTVTALVLPSGGTYTGRIASRGLHLTPSLKWFPWGGRGATRLCLGAGAGYYLLDFTEMFSWGETDEIYEDGTLGGYASVGVRLPVSASGSGRMAVMLQTKVHLVEFADLAPGTGQINGPLYMFQLGLSF